MELRAVVVLLMALACCCSCSVPGRTGSAADSANMVQPPGKSEVAPPFVTTQPQATSPVSADRILGVQAQDQLDQVVITFSGNAAVRDYSFQRLGDSQFAMEFSGISRDAAARAPVSNSSKTLKYIYVDEARPGTVRFVGGLGAPLKDHLLTSLDNSVMLTLQTAAQGKKQKNATSAKSAPSGGNAATAAPKQPAFTGPVTAAPGAVAPAAPAGREGTVLGTADLYTGKPISLDLQDAELKNVLRLLADVSGINMVVEPDVTGRVTLKVDRVPWDQVLDLVLKMNDLGRQQVGDVVRIARRDRINQEVKIQEDRIKAEQQLSEAALHTGEITTVFFTLNYAQPAAFQGILSKMMSERGKVSYDDRTNSVIYSDYPYFIDNARQLLARLDRPKAQVLIEARIVRVSATRTWALGVEWNWGTLNPNPNTFLNNFSVNAPVSSVATMGFMLGKVAGNSIDLTLSALETTGDGKVISAPRVVTVDGTEAVISQGTDVPYLQLSQNGTAATAFRKAVLELKVRPHITPDGKVRMELHAKKEEPDFSRTVGIEAQPPINTREIVTELIVDDGNTIVIGGVIEESDSISRNSTPGISNIPIIGNLFRSNANSKEKTELLIFITPRVVGVTIPDGIGNSAGLAPGGYRVGNLGWYSRLL